MHEAWLRTEALGDDELRRASALSLGIPFKVLDREDISIDAMLLIPEPLARTRNVFAYAQGQDGSIEVIVLDMADLEALQFLQPANIKARLTTRASMKQALLFYQKHLKEKFAGMLERGTEAVDSLLRHALISGATHVHLEPALAGALVRYRIAGYLTEAMRLSSEAASAVRERLKRLARLFPVETTAQEGGFAFEHEDGVVAVGVSTMPTVRGEKMLLRLAREFRGQSGFSLSALGFHGRSLERMHALLERRKGLIAISGEGKTTLLYTMLDLLASPALSLASVEHVPAHKLPAVWQMQTRPEVGLTIAGSLRAVLRIDPDVVMIDDLDSSEAASAASEAARRGIFVLAAEGTERVERPDARVSARVFKRLCPHCRHAFHPARAELSWLEKEGVRFSRVLSALKEEEAVETNLQWKDVVFYRAAGCEKCLSGYLGSIGAQEITPSAEEDLSLLEDALYKAVQGLISLEEIISG